MQLKRVIAKAKTSNNIYPKVSSLRRIRKTPRVRDLYRQLEERNSKKRDDIEQIVLKLHHYEGTRW